MTEFNKCLFKSGILKRIKVFLGGLNNPRRKLEKIFKEAERNKNASVNGKG